MTEDDALGLEHMQIDQIMKKFPLCRATNREQIGICRLRQNSYRDEVKQCLLMSNGDIGKRMDWKVLPYWIIYFIQGSKREVDMFSNRVRAWQNQTDAWFEKYRRMKNLPDESSEVQNQYKQTVDKRDEVMEFHYDQWKRGYNKVASAYESGQKNKDNTHPGRFKKDRKVILNHPFQRNYYWVRNYGKPGNYYLCPNENSLKERREEDPWDPKYKNDPIQKKYDFSTPRMKDFYEEFLRNDPRKDKNEALGEMVDNMNKMNSKVVEMMEG